MSTQTDNATTRRLLKIMRAAFERVVYSLATRARHAGISSPLCPFSRSERVDWDENLNFLAVYAMLDSRLFPGYRRNMIRAAARGRDELAFAAGVFGPSLPRPQWQKGCVEQCYGAYLFGDGPLACPALDDFDKGSEFRFARHGTVFFTQFSLSAALDDAPIARSMWSINGGDSSSGLIEYPLAGLAPYPMADDALKWLYAEQRKNPRRLPWDAEWEAAGQKAGDA